MAPKFVENAQVVSNEQLASNIWKVVLSCNQTPDAILPGQFVHLQVDGGCKAMLRRPFSIMNADAENKTIDIVYEVKGAGTTMMTKWQKGYTTNIIAPLGNSWLATLPEGEDSKISRALIVGGGVGAAPLFMLARNFVKKGISVDVVLGARTKEALVMEAPYRTLDLNTLICTTDDGSYGEAGFCTIPAERLINENSYDYVGTCGPAPVMKAVADAAKEKAKFVEVSTEERMACGVGACKTCVVDTVNGKVKSCDCGPVFPAEVISW